MVKTVQESILELQNAIAFAVLHCFHLFDDEHESVHFQCARCRWELTSTRDVQEQHVMVKLVTHLGEHLDDQD